MEKVQNYLDIAITYSLERMSNENHLSIGPKRDCFSGGSAGKESTCNVGGMDLILGLGKIPWRREQVLTPVFWPGEFHGLYSPWGLKELDMTEQLSLCPGKPICLAFHRLVTREKQR